MTNIIKLRLAKVFRTVHRPVSSDHKRGTYKRGVVRYSHHVTTPMDDALLARLNALAKELNINRAAIMRDAIAHYLDIAEREMTLERKDMRDG